MTTPRTCPDCGGTVYRQMCPVQLRTGRGLYEPDEIVVACWCCASCDWSVEIEEGDDV